MAISSNKRSTVSSGWDAQSIPDVLNNENKYLTTDGSTVSWGVLNIPDTGFTPFLLMGA